ncbi:MAG: hypothetical protein U1E76_20695 [Planctomycetota bacterium]
MSLQRRILKLVILVSLLVTGGLAGVIWVSGHQRDQRLDAWLQEREAETLAGFLEQFNRDWSSLGEVASGEEPKLKTLALRELGRYCAFAQVRWRKSGALPEDVLINPMGSRHRPDDFDPERARRQIDAVIDASERASDRKAMGRDGNWVAVPLYYTVVDDRGTQWRREGRRLLPVEGSRIAEAARGPGHRLGAGDVRRRAAARGRALLGLAHERAEAPRRARRRRRTRRARRVRGRCRHPGRGDEVDHLVQAFNAMMAAVADYSKNLELRVAEATARAEAARRHLIVAQRLAATGATLPASRTRSTIHSAAC